MGHSSRQQQAENNAIKKSTFMEKTTSPLVDVKNLPFPPLSFRHRAICNPPLDRPVAGLHVSASLDVKPPAFQSAMLRCTPPSKPSYQVFSIPSTPAALDFQQPTSWDVARHETTCQSLQNSKHIFFKYKQI